MAKGKVRVSITGDSDGLKRSTRQAEGHLGRLETRGSRAMRGLARASGAALLGIGAAAVASGPKLISLASDAEETASKFRTVFGRETKEAINQLDAFSKATGTSRFALREQAAQLQALIRPMGLQANQAARMSTGLTQLATDLASFNNTDVQTAMTALQSGLVGEAEPLRKFGVQLSAARVETVAYAKGIARQGEELTAAQKAQAAYAIILDDTKLAQGDATKTADSFANQFKRLKNQVTDTATELGVKLLPTAKNVVGAITGFITQMRTGEGAGGRFAAKVKEIATEIWPVVRGVGQAAADVARFASSMVQAIGPATTLGAVMGGLVGRFAGLRLAAIVTGVAGMVTAFGAASGAAGGLAGRMAVLNATMRANPFVMLATVIGTVAGALLGMKSKSDSAKVSGDQLNQMLRSQADAMRAVRDIDLEAAQRKANHQSATVALEQAEERLRDLRRSGTATATEIAAAEADVEQARLQTVRTGKEVARIEEDAHAARQRAADEARKLIPVYERRLNDTNKEIDALKEQKAELDEMGASTETAGKAGKRYRDIVAALSDKQKTARGTTLDLKKQQLALAEATGASRHTVDRLKAEIAGLKSKTVTVTAKVKMQATSQALQSVRGLLGGGPSGAGWPLTGKDLDEAVTKDATRWAQGRADRLGKQVGKALSSVSGMLGGRGASGVDAFTPIARRMGLTMTSGYRPGDPGWHGVNRARDYSNGSGPTGQMMMFARYMAANFGRKLKELIYTPLGFSVRNGRRVPPFAQADHYDHVHVAMHRGGPVPGEGSGDKVPALLEPEEFVIRKQIVRKFGPTFFTALNNDEVPGFMSGGQVARLARKAGFKGSKLVTALAIARGESGWREGATNRNTDGSIDRGLWQINSVHGALSTLNPAANARAAWRISKGGRDWSPWVVFQKGLHRQHIAAARRAALATRPGRGTRGGGGGGGGATERQEPHPLDVLPPIHERRMAVADIAHARAEATPGTADDVLAQKRKLAAVDTRIRRVRGALRKKLRPGTRARLRQEYAGLLRERQSLIGEMTPEAAVPPTLEDFQAQRTALAGLTPGLGDDLSAAENALQLAERRYHEALPGGDPRVIAEAANNVRAAADQVNQLREQMISLEEQVRQAAEAERKLWPSAELAMAQLTETLDDDIAAQRKLNAINEQLYQQALAANDPARIIEAAGALKGTRDALDQLRGEIRRDAEQRASEMKALTDEMRKQNQYAEQVTATNLRTVWEAVADLVSGQIAGVGYQGRQLTAGAGSVYRA